MILEFDHLFSHIVCDN